MSAPAERTVFISYTGKDAPWVDWIGAQLRDAGIPFIHAGWDFLPGDDFIEEMDVAVQKAAVTIMVLTPNYKAGNFTGAEWRAVFARVQTSGEKRLFGVLVEGDFPAGLLGSIVHLDFKGRDEAACRDLLLAGVRGEPVRPTGPQAFPGKPATTPLFSPAPAVPPPNNLPFLPSRIFRGRDEQLRALKEALAEAEAVAVSRPAAVHGPPGVGKTMLAVEYAWAHAAEHTHLLWVSAEKPGGLQAGLAALAAKELLALPEAAQPDLEAQERAVRGWLRAQRDWLLIIDNADDDRAIDAVCALEPELRGGRVLITTRHAHWGPDFADVEVPLFPREESIKFLRGRAGEAAGPEVDAARVAEELGYLPLALAQAAAVIALEKITFAGYLARLTVARRGDTLRHLPPHSTRYPRPVAEAWAVSVARLSPVARALLRMGCWLAPEPIPRALFSVNNITLRVAVVRFAWFRGIFCPVDSDSALVELASASLITLTPETATIHRLLRAIEQDTCDADEEKIWLLLSLRALNRHLTLDQQPWEPAVWPVWALAAPHLSAVLAQCEQRSIENGPLSWLATVYGLYLKARAQYEKAEPLFRRALAIGEKVRGAEHPKVATYLNNLAGLLQATGRLKEGGATRSAGAGH